MSQIKKLCIFETENTDRNFAVFSFYLQEDKYEQNSNRYTCTDNKESVITTVLFMFSLTEDDIMLCSPQEALRRLQLDQKLIELSGKLKADPSYIAIHPEEYAFLVDCTKKYAEICRITGNTDFDFEKFDKLYNVQNNDK